LSVPAQNWFTFAMNGDRLWPRADQVSGKPPNRSSEFRDGVGLQRGLN